MLRSHSVLQTNNKYFRNFSLAGSFVILFCSININAKYCALIFPNRFLVIFLWRALIKLFFFFPLLKNVYLMTVDGILKLSRWHCVRDFAKMSPAENQHWPSRPTLCWIGSILLFVLYYLLFVLKSRNNLSVV